MLAVWKAGLRTDLSRSFVTRRCADGRENRSHQPAYFLPTNLTRAV
jgi:hypothetical protein